MHVSLVSCNRYNSKSLSAEMRFKVQIEFWKRKNFDWYKYISEVDDFKKNKFEIKEGRK